VRRTFHYFSLLVLLLFAVQLASAQNSSFDVNVGFGAAQAPASKTGIDQNTFLSCTLGAAFCSPTPSLNSFMLGFGGNLILWKHLGFGAEVNFQPSKQTFANLQAGNASQGIATINLQSRVTLYDFNAIYQPLATKKAALQLVGGIGGVNLRFYEAASGNNALVGNFNSSQYAASSNHFQVHGGVGVQFYVTEHVFIRPQFDVHYVNNFIQFGRNLVTSETVWLGYSFGRQ
jgi:hypothetical protein